MQDALKESLRLSLEKWPETRLALLFGSLAADRGRPDSDLDLAIDLGRPLGAEERIGIIEELAARIGRPVDLIDLRAAGQPLLSHIVVNGRRVLGTDAAYAEWIRRHLFDQHDFMPYLERINRERRAAWIGS